MDTPNNNRIIWYKTSEVEPPPKKQLWVCDVDVLGRLSRKIRLDSWDPVWKNWRNHNETDSNTYWTYPVYPDIK